MSLQLHYTTDLHGNERSYEELLSKATDENENSVVLGGDFSILENAQRQGLFLRGWLNPLRKRFRAKHSNIKIF